jgi:DNA-binding Lrp family transcriptional regulator
MADAKRSCSRGLPNQQQITDAILGHARVVTGVNRFPIGPPGSRPIKSHIASVEPADHHLAPQANLLYGQTGSTDRAIAGELAPHISSDRWRTGSTDRAIAGRMGSMITAFVSISARPESIASLGRSTADIPGVREVHSTTGEYDLIAILWVPDHDSIATIVTEKISKLPGVESTRTSIAFRTYSSADLGTM